MKRSLISFKFKIHPLFLLLLVGSLFVGWWMKWLVLFALVLLHEMGHVAAALALGYRIREVEILPFGGVAKLEHGSLGWNPRHEVWIAIAGPAVNGIIILLCVFLNNSGKLTDSWSSYLIQSNLTLAFFNLLPGLPLDGGRILRAAMATQVGFLHATEVASRMALILSVVMVTIGISTLWLGYLNVGMTTLGLFLFLSSWQLRKQRQYDLIRFLDAKKRHMKHGTMLNRGLVADAQITLEQVAGEFIPDAYHMISVYDEKNDFWHIISEEQILFAIFEGTGPKTRLWQLIKPV